MKGSKDDNDCGTLWQQGSVCDDLYGERDEVDSKKYTEFSST
jgi:hypothetical protein